MLSFVCFLNPFLFFLFFLFFNKLKGLGFYKGYIRVFLQEGELKGTKIRWRMLTSS